MEIVKKIFLPLFFFMVFSCKSNPFWDAQNTEALTVSGSLMAENRQTDIPISVWMESINYYTTTDSAGYFSIPVSNSQTLDGNLTGPVIIYFFIYNYQLESATIYFTDGLFSKEQTDFSQDGELLRQITLKKILSGETILQFSENDLDSNDTLQVEFEIITYQSTSLFAYKYIWHPGGLDFHSGLFFNPVDGNDAPVYMYRFSGYDEYGNVVNDQLRNFSYEDNQSISWEFLINAEHLDLEPGSYGITPFFRIQHDYIPTGLVNAIGGDSLFIFSEKFLELPMDVISDTLTISE